MRDQKHLDHIEANAEKYSEHIESTKKAMGSAHADMGLSLAEIARRTSLKPDTCKKVIEEGHGNLRSVLLVASCIGVNLEYANETNN